MVMNDNMKITYLLKMYSLYLILYIDVKLLFFHSNIVVIFLPKMVH